MQRHFGHFLLAFLFWAPEILGFAFLSEFVSQDGKTLRPQGIIGLGSDQILHPRWNSSINLVLCTGGSAIRETKLRTNPSNVGLSDAQWFDKVFDSLNAAIDEWNAAYGNLSWIPSATRSAGCGPNTGQAFGGRNGQNQIFFNSVFEDGSTLPRGVLGYTILSLEPQNGQLRIVEADIILNAMAYSNYTNMEYYEPAGIITHELGHLLGIAHSLVNDDNKLDDPMLSSATMYPKVIGDGAYLSALATDDSLAARNLYSNTSVGGTLKGAVFNSQGTPLRAAQVSVFGLDDNTSITATLSGMSQTRSSTDGSFEIRGIPLDSDFIVFVEPLDRPDIDSSHRFTVINTPTTHALNSEATGFRNFFIEAYPDARIVDIRKVRDVNVSPGISGAQTFRFSSNGQIIENIHFYVSQTTAPPNDAFEVELRINPKVPTSQTLTINNSQTLQLFVEVPTELKIFNAASLQLLATRGSETFDWTSSIPSFQWQQQSALITTSLPSPAPSNGTYQIQFIIEDPKYGRLEVSRTAEISNWTKSSPAVSFGGRSSADQVKSKSGCALRLDPSNPNSSKAFLFLIFLAIFYFCRDLYRAKTPRSY